MKFSCRHNIFLILLFLATSILLGLAESRAITSEEVTSSVGIGEQGFGDDECFDVLVHSINHDLAECYTPLRLAPIATSIEKPLAENVSVCNAETVTLPLRAPPMLG